MNNLQKKNTYGFIALYLLGGARHSLERNFQENYINSEALTLLEKDKRRVAFRNMNIIRLEILRGFSYTYKDRSKVENWASKFNTSYLDLKEYGVNLDEVYYANNSYLDVINHLSSLIASLTPVIIRTLDMQFISGITDLFYYPIYKEADLLRVSRQYNKHKAKYPFTIYIHNASTFGTYLRGLFLHDSTLIISCNSLVGDKQLDLGEVYKDFEWSNLASDSNHTVPITGDAEFYVDCDNISHKEFIGLVDYLNKNMPSSNFIFNLYIDGEHKEVWNYIKTRTYKNITFNPRLVERIRASKSLVDIVITSDITRSEILNPMLSRFIVSSDSDFLGVAVSGVEIAGVLYMKQYASVGYLTELKTRNIPSFNIERFSNEVAVSNFETGVLVDLMLSKIPSATLGSLNVDFLLTETINEISLKDHFLEGVQPHRIRYLAEHVLSNCKLLYKDGSFKVSLDEDFNNLVILVGQEDTFVDIYSIN